MNLCLKPSDLKIAEKKDLSTVRIGGKGVCGRVVDEKGFPVLVENTKTMPMLMWPRAEIATKWAGNRNEYKYKDVLLNDDGRFDKDILLP